MHTREDAEAKQMLSERQKQKKQTLSSSSSKKPAGSNNFLRYDSKKRSHDEDNIAQKELVSISSNPNENTHLFKQPNRELLFKHH